MVPVDGHRGDIVMSVQSERIHAALLRCKAERSAAGGHQFKPTKPEETARPLIVVNEQNLAAFFLSSVSRPDNPETPCGSQPGGIPRNSVRVGPTVLLEALEPSAKPSAFSVLPLSASEPQRS